MSGVFNTPGDLAFDEDTADWVWDEELDSLAQQVALGFVCLRGTWYFDLSQGFPMLMMFTSIANLAYADRLIREYLMSFEDILEVLSLEINPTEDTDGKVLANVKFTCRTSFGTLSSSDMYMPQISEL